MGAEGLSFAACSRETKPCCGGSPGAAQHSLPETPGSPQTKGQLYHAPPQPGSAQVGSRAQASLLLVLLVSGWVAAALGADGPSGGRAPHPHLHLLEHKGACFLVTRYIRFGCLPFLSLPCHTLKSPHPQRVVLRPGCFPGDPFSGGVACGGTWSPRSHLWTPASPRGLPALSCVDPSPRFGVSKGFAGP